MAAAYAIVSADGSLDCNPGAIGDVQLMAALAAWRVGQGIYRFDLSLAPGNQIDTHNYLAGRGAVPIAGMVRVYRGGPRARRRFFCLS